MSSPLRLEYCNALYHITAQGNDNQSIFIDELDRENFLQILAQARTRYKWLCHAYCLMDNHYHLIIETPYPNLSRGMRQLNGRYTHVFNKHHFRTGHIFQGRYKAIHVEKESYLLSLCRHIVLSPVKAKLVQDPKDWQWSSYLATAGYTEVPSFLTVSSILSAFSHKIRSARKQYKQFINDDMDSDVFWKDLRGKVILGSDRFLDSLKDQITDKKNNFEIPKHQRFLGSTPLADIFTDKIRGNKEKRNEMIYSAFKDHGYTQKIIADFLNLHYASISRIIKDVENKDK
ncbi:MAG: transposase [Nitrospirae bacterium]|nr:transposase [Nitrospirota bacterium]